MAFMNQYFWPRWQFEHHILVFAKGNKAGSIIFISVFCVLQTLKDTTYSECFPFRPKGNFFNQIPLSCYLEIGIRSLHQLYLFSHNIFHVLHYGPLEGSKDGKAEVLNFLHELPDYTWQEPDQDDPLSLVDQVCRCFERKVKKSQTCDFFQTRWSFPLPMVAPTLWAMRSCSNMCIAIATTITSDLQK